MLGWWHARRAREAARDQFLSDLVLDQARRVGEGDEDALEAQRIVVDVGRAGSLAQAAIVLSMAMLVVTVVPLVVLFRLIKQWVG